MPSHKFRQRINRRPSCNYRIVEPRAIIVLLTYIYLTVTLLPFKIIPLNLRRLMLLLTAFAW